MRSIHQLLEQARRGDDRYKRDIITFLMEAPRIILRGAGIFGEAFGRQLIIMGVSQNRLVYWDIRANALQALNGIPVRIPFAEEFDKTTTIAINCIPNGSLSGTANRNEFEQRGFHNYFSGMAIFEALMCSLKPGKEFDAKVCLDTTICNWCSCKRMTSVLQQCRLGAFTKPAEELVFQVATFVINQKCTLECTHCGQYINHYPEEERINFPLERIVTDIDRVLEAVDAIGYISIIGGEPFLHPDLGDIIDHFLTKKNFGVLGITTNGICKLSKKLLLQLKNDRTRIIFSDYTAALSDKQKYLFDTNIGKVSEMGVPFTIGKPLWHTPASLRKLHLPIDTKASMKISCNSRNTCKTIQNGIYYPCSTTAGIGSHKQADYPMDWIDIDKKNSVAELRKSFLMIENQSYYESCDHCGEGGLVLDLSGKQGRGAEYAHIELNNLLRNKLTST
jgi:hypothetical protein